MEGRILGQLKLRPPQLALGAADPADSQGSSGFEESTVCFPESEAQGPVKVLEFEVLPPQDAGPSRGRSPLGTLQRLVSLAAQATPEKIRMRRSNSAKAGIDVPGIPAAGVGVGSKQEQELEFLRQAVTISSWGAGERTGGWRFHSTSVQSINTNISGLSALVAIPDGRKTKGRFRATANVNLSWVDRLVKGLYFQPPPETSIEYEFPHELT